MRAGLAVLSLVAAVCAHGAAQAQDAWPDERVKQELLDRAFDPARFQGEGASDLVRIRYTGDDWGWPIWSMLIRNSCGVKREPGCRERRIAWMVRAPVPPMGAERPRWRGLALVRALTERKPRNEAEMTAALDGAKLDWVEADLGSCPGALPLLAAAGELEWATPDVIAPAAGQETELVLHADDVEVQFLTFRRTATYNGFVAEGSAAAWAVRLAELLEPCWKPSAATPPWHRPAPSRR